MNKRIIMGNPNVYDIFLGILYYLPKNKQQFKKLAIKWGIYLQALKTNGERAEELNQKSASLEVREETIELCKQSQKQRDYDLYKREVALKDKYKTLEDAIEEHRKNGITI